MSSKELLNAQAHLWNILFSFMDSQSLKCCVQLGIPNAIYKHGKPMSLPELASALSIPTSRTQNLERILNLLVHNNIFTKEEEHYSLTPNSMLLVSEKAESMLPFIELILDEALLAPWSILAPWLKSEQPSTAFEMYHGSYYFDATAKNPSLLKHTMLGLEADSAAVAKVIIEDCADQFEGINSLVEVAGVTGKIAKEVKKAFPHIKCTLFELPHVIDAIENKSDDLEYVAGDMFKSIPSADALILKWVLMIWSDEECVKILTQCKKAVPSKENGGKIIIVDKVIDQMPEVDHPQLDQTKVYFDLQTVVYVTGRQRTEKEWKSLFDAVGFKEYKIIPALGMRSIIELYH